MAFIRKQVRLHTDVYDVYRYLTKTERIEKWCDLVPLAIQGQAYTQVTWSLKAADRVTFYLMKCAQKSEYCTEVHAMFEGALEPEKESWLESLLEALRKHYNKEWVISESDVLTDRFR